MACKQREMTGHCSHHQCEFSENTEHGYECVDLLGNYCEVGDDCLDECHHSWTGREVLKRIAKLAEQTDPEYFNRTRREY